MTHKQPPCSYEEILEYYKNPNNRSIEQSILSLELKPISIGPGHFTQGYGWFDTRKNFWIEEIYRSRFQDLIA